MAHRCADNIFRSLVLSLSDRITKTTGQHLTQGVEATAIADIPGNSSCWLSNTGKLSHSGVMQVLEKPVLESEGQ